MTRSLKNPDWPRRFKTSAPYVLSHAQKVTLGGRPQRISWAQIEPDGTEETRTGEVWSRAPDLKGMSAYWVLMDPLEETPHAPASGQIARERTPFRVDPAPGTRALTFERTPSECADTRPCVCVVRAHRVTVAGRVRGARFRPAQGRTIHAGEWYSETHADSRTGSATRAAWQAHPSPTVIKTVPLPPDVMITLGNENGWADPSA
jgi:hypothetical protein